MENDLNLIRRDLNEIKIEIALIKEWILDDEFGEEVSKEVVDEVEKSRRKNGKDLVSHEEVLKKFVHEHNWMEQKRNRFFRKIKQRGLKEDCKKDGWNKRKPN